MPAFILSALLWTYIQTLLVFVALFSVVETAIRPGAVWLWPCCWQTRYACAGRGDVTSHDQVSLKFNAVLLSYSYIYGDASCILVISNFWGRGLLPLWVSFPPPPPPLPLHCSNTNPGFVQSLRVFESPLVLKSQFEGLEKSIETSHSSWKWSKIQICGSLKVLWWWKCLSCTIK